MDGEITKLELLAALKTCQDSCPGSDGNPYSVYKKLWIIVSPFIIDPWRYSCQTGTQPLSHRESIIILIPKEGKETRDIKNWRAITLTNCDAKIITKALANRMSLVLRSIQIFSDHCAEQQVDSVLVSHEVCTISSIVLLLNIMGHNMVFISLLKFIRYSLYKYI